MRQRPTVFVGIDPGVSGAVALLDTREKPRVRPVTIFDVPVFARVVNGTTRRQIDERLLAEQLSREVAAHHVEGSDMDYVRANTIVAIEQIGPMPGQGIATTATLMCSWGIIRGVVAGLGLRAGMMMPAEWRRAAGLSMRSLTKGEDSLAKARELFPTAAPVLARKMDHNRAEALLIAHAAARALEIGADMELEKAG